MWKEWHASEALACDGEDELEQATIDELGVFRTGGFNRMKRVPDEQQFG
jgi:hypothetical protein